MTEKSENGRTIVDLIIILGKSKTANIIIFGLIVYLYVLEPQKGAFINQSVKAWVVKTTSSEHSKTVNHRRHISNSKQASNNPSNIIRENEPDDVFTVQIFATHYEDKAQMIMGNLRIDSPSIWVSKEANQYHIYLGQYRSEIEASDALGKLIAKKKKDMFFRENRPFVKKLSNIT